MTKRILSIVAVFALLAFPTMSMADEVTTNSTSWFDTDSYDEDGCFC